MSEGAIRALFERVALGGRLATEDPAILGDYARWFLSARLSRSSYASSARIQPATLSLEQAYARISALAGDVQPGPALDLVRRSLSASATPGIASAANEQAASMAGDTSLGELVYGLARAIQPQVVVETGVATGVTSAFLLAALADNARGHLFSIDLPPTRMVAAGLVGVAVPHELRQRWTYCWGSSRRLLPRLLASRRSEVQLFVHDSDHRYEAMRWELEHAWAALEPSGWLVADDATLHSAVDDLARALGVAPLYVRQSAKPDATALLYKPSPGHQYQEAIQRARGTSRQLQPR